MHQRPGGTQGCVLRERISQDHKDSSTKSGRHPSRREDGKGVYRRLGVLSELQFGIVFADQYTKFVFVYTLKAKSEALANLKQIVLSVGTPKKLRQDMRSSLSQISSRCTA